MLEYRKICITWEKNKINIFHIYLVKNIPKITFEYLGDFHFRIKTCFDEISSDRVNLDSLLLH